MHLSIGLKIYFSKMKWSWFAMTLILLNSCSNQNQVTSDIITNQPISYPCHRIDYEQIKVYPMQVMIHQDNIIHSGVLNTNSMLPTITSESTILLKKPTSIQDVCIGDIIYYKTNNCTFPKSEFVLHRVISQNEDILGIYYNAKGDNNGNVIDNCKIRYEDIKYVVVGILY